MTGDKPPLAMTMGDPAGIGPEIALEAWRARVAGAPPFFVLASPELLFATAELASLDTPIIETEPGHAAAVFDKGLPVVPLEHRVEADPGRPDTRNAAATIESIARAAKAVLYDAGFRFPGHTEYLGELAKAWGEAAFPVMMIWSETLAVVPITIHIPLSEAPKALSAELIAKTARVV